MAKRTYEQSKTFFNRKTNTRGCGRELYKTPRFLIRTIINDLLFRFPYLKKEIWIDPCAGDGRWEQEIYNIDSSIKVISLDIEPLQTKSVIQQDFFKFSKERLEKIINERNWQNNGIYFFIGNPPFSKVKQFIEYTINKFNSHGFYLGGSAILTGKLSKYAEYIYRFDGAEGKQKDMRSKALFEDTNGKIIPIWCCGIMFNNKCNFEFKRTTEQKEGYFRVGVKSWCIDEQPRVLKIKL